MVTSICGRLESPRLALFGEMCTVGDMNYLAVKLSQLGVGDYWEDVDRYTRNQLVEGQVTDADKLRRAAAASPILCGSIRNTRADPVQTPMKAWSDSKLKSIRSKKRRTTFANDSSGHICPSVAGQPSFPSTGS